MRILVVTHYFDRHGGGVERVAASLVARLANWPGVEVVWAASDCDPATSGLPTGAATVAMKSWNGFERRLGFPWPIWSPLALLRLWSEVGRADVVHLHDALYFGNIAASVFARLRSVPIVVTQHVGAVPYRLRFLRWLHSVANRTVAAYVLRRAAQVVFISPAVENEFARFCRYRVEPTYIPNGVDTAVFCPMGPVTDDPVVTDAAVHGRPVWLFVGRFVEKKGLHLLRELVDRCPDALWVFAGHGPLDPDGWKAANVRVLRGRSGESLAAIYRAADLLVLPSVGEGFPLVVQESMSCGTAVLVGDSTAAGCPSARHLMFVESLDECGSERWLRRLGELHDKRAELLAVGIEASRYARDNWSWESCVRRYMEIFLRVRR